ncbi:unnamed protein product [Polarella glacialis]|uniref:Uncharacterized protein n=1 Tax=Polarella glacialis TaxID=89957 RepID=A0A813JWF2_POLGL|nr:unnamed protein product [Polarella glacialis]CAE8685858.1 unnamed protein product [Polarella glacialis]
MNETVTELKRMSPDLAERAPSPFTRTVSEPSTPAERLVLSPSKVVIPLRPQLTITTSVPLSPARLPAQAVPSPVGSPTRGATVYLGIASPTTMMPPPTG